MAPPYRRAKRGAVQVRGSDRCRLLWREPRRSAAPAGSRQFLMNAPVRRSVSAWRIWSCVFITIGPCQAIGSRKGRPETSRKRTPSSPAWTLISSPAPNTTSERLPTRVAHQHLLAVDLSFAQRAERRRGVGEIARALEDIGEGLAEILDLEALALARRHGDVEIAGIGGDAVDRPCLAPELAADDAHARAVVVDHFRDRRLRERPGSAASSS